MNQIASFINNGVARLIGITGAAGSGKSTLTKELGFPSYHIDSAFIGDSNFRKGLLLEKQSRSAESFLDMTSQYNWWDWEQVEEKVLQLKGYSKPSLIEGAILGPPVIVNMLDIILFLEVPERVRLTRLLKRDVPKRTASAVIERLLLTNRSEEIYYEYLNKYYSNKIYRINERYEFI